MTTVVIWLLVLSGVIAIGRVDDSDFHDPEDHIEDIEKFSPAPADLPKGPVNG